MSKDGLNLAKWAIDKALKCGANQAAVAISNQRDIEVDFRDRKMEKLQESTQNSLALRIFVDKKYSRHSTCDMRKESLEKFIQDAVAMTRYLTPDEYRSLPDPKYYPQKTNIDLDINDKKYSAIETEDRVKIAAAIEQAALAQSDKIITASAGYSDTHYQVFRMHSNGFAGQTEGTAFSSYAQVTVNDPNGGRPSDWEGGDTRYYNELPPVEEIGKNAVQRALSRIGQKKIASGLYTMIVDNRVAARLLSMLTSAITGQALQQKSTYLDGMLNKPIAADKLTVIEDPFIKRGASSRIYDGEGLAARKRTIIEKGVLKEYLIDDYYGKKMGIAPNSGSLSNVVFEYGAESQTSMIKSVKKGIIVNSFIGGNSNTTTGDFSFGIIGQLVENGEIIMPVNEMNISGNGKEFWQKLTVMGNDPYPYSSVKIPTLLFEDVQFSGI
ncbi:MAG TPA: TldD/PmbA family protein [bacterium]|nr:TldD/PmbA family protein [bacterium]HPN45707.1 TldD/PmbA family protein [bacterium]